MVRLLLQSGKVADINQGSVRGYTPLQVAAGSHAPTIIRLLLDNGADVNRGNPLLTAVWSGNVDVVRELLRQDDIDVNAQDSWARTALLEMAQCGNIRITKLLLASRHINVNHVGGPMRSSALALAVSFGHYHVVRLLLAREDIDVSTLFWSDRGQFKHALTVGDEATVRELLQHAGVRTSLTTEQGKDVLSTAVRHGNMGVVRALLAHNGVDVTWPLWLDHQLLEMAYRLLGLEKNVVVRSKMYKGR